MLANDDSALGTCACPPELLDALARLYTRAAVRQCLTELEAKEAGAASLMTEEEAARRARKRGPRVHRLGVSRRTSESPGEAACVQSDVAR